MFRTVSDFLPAVPASRSASIGEMLDAWMAGKQRGDDGDGEAEAVAQQHAVQREA